MPSSETNGKDRIQSPKEALKALRDEVLATCAREVEEVLKKHDCKLVGMPGLAPDGNGGWRIIVRVDVLANPE
jgi:hypothetical protein